MNNSGGLSCKKFDIRDVVAYANDHTVVAECKGGVINTRHAGQVSRLRSGLCEVVGLLMSRAPNAERHIAVVPNAIVTARLAETMAQRCKITGIEIALINEESSVVFAPAKESLYFNSLWNFHSQLSVVIPNYCWYSQLKMFPTKGPHLGAFCLF